MVFEIILIIKSLIQNCLLDFVTFAIYRVALRIDAISNQLSDDGMVSSQSFANLLHLPSHANVRSTTQRLAMTTNPTASLGRRTISIVGLGSMFNRSHATLSPA